MRFYPWQGLRAKLRIGSHLGRDKLVSEQYRPRSPLDWSNLAELSLVKNCFESSYISESRILFSPLLCSGEESWRNNLILLLFPLKKKFRITWIFLGSIWCRCDEVLSWCLLFDLIFFRGVELQGILEHIVIIQISFYLRTKHVRNCFNTSSGEITLMSPVLVQIVREYCHTLYRCDHEGLL